MMAVGSGAGAVEFWPERGLEEEEEEEDPEGADTMEEG